MKNQDQYPNADRQIMLRDNGQHLPSTEVRELVPDYEDEIDLRETLRRDHRTDLVQIFLRVSVKNSRRIACWRKLPIESVELLVQ